MNFEEMIHKEMEKMPSIGATGNYPHGKLNDEDRGGVTTAVYVEKDKIVVNMGTMISWFGLTAEQAETLAEALLKKVQEIKQQQAKS